MVRHLLVVISSSVMAFLEVVLKPLLTSSASISQLYKIGLHVFFSGAETYLNSGG